MSTTKVYLKAAKAALDRQDYAEAVEYANKVLTSDSKNYHAYVSAAASNKCLN